MNPWTILNFGNWEPTWGCMSIMFGASRFQNAGHVQPGRIHRVSAGMRASLWKLLLIQNFRTWYLVLWNEVLIVPRSWANCGVSKVMGRFMPRHYPLVDDAMQTRHEDIWWVALPWRHLVPHDCTIWYYMDPYGNSPTFEALSFHTAGWWSESSCGCCLGQGSPFAAIYT